MNINTIYESDIEEAAIDWFAELGYTVLHGPDIAPDTPDAERSAYSEVILERRFRDAVARLNPNIPAEAQEDAIRKVLYPDSPILTQNNRAFHLMLVDGIEVEARQPDGTVRGERVRLVDFDTPENNDWLAVNQFTVVERSERRPDVVLFINGLPLAVIELKNPTDEKATILTAFRQICTYKQEIPPLFTYNETIVISDGLEARIGSLTADQEWFLPWRTIEGEDEAPSTELELEVLIKGIFEKERFLSYLKHFVVFEETEGETIAKKIAGYHQFHAVKKAVDTTVEASRPEGDKQCGVVWHTQGSGKSLTMAFYAGSIAQHPQMENPTLVIITDRNDLDEQLFRTFARCSQLLRQTPVQARDRGHLRKLLTVASGGVVFTTVQKFFPEVMKPVFLYYPIGGTLWLSQTKRTAASTTSSADLPVTCVTHFPTPPLSVLPAHRLSKPIATPAPFLEITSASTTYNVRLRTVPPFRFTTKAVSPELNWMKTKSPTLTRSLRKQPKGKRSHAKRRLKTKWAQLEALVGTEKRVGLIADDIIKHFAERLETMDGKAMIVCMSRRICVDLYNALVARCPEWHNDDDKQGTIKVVMTGSSDDDPSWQQHIRNKARREEMAGRFKNPKDPLKVVIVRDMWLTGFDAPSLHTMYVDKPMRGHGLMQAIARVNRVFGDKPGGLIVDYIGLAYHLKQALANYTESGGKGETAVDKAEAVAVMLEKYEVCCGLFYSFDWSSWIAGNATDRLKLLPSAQEHILGQKDGKTRLLETVTALSKAFALAVPHEKTTEIRDDVAFFQAVRGVLAKPTATEEAQSEATEQAIKQLISRAVVSEGVVDIFAAAGLEKPDVSILSDEFLVEVRDLPHKNVAVELLEKLLNDEIRTHSRKNVVQGRSFAEMLERSIRAYQNRTVEAAQVIEELIEIAKEMRQAQDRGEELGLSDDELAFYDALEVNDSAVQVLGSERCEPSQLNWSKPSGRM